MVMKAKYDSSVNAAWVADTFITSSLRHNVIFFMKLKQISLKVKLAFSIFSKYTSVSKNAIMYMIIIHDEIFFTGRNIMITTQFSTCILLEVRFEAYVLRYMLF